MPLAPVLAVSPFDGGDESCSSFSLSSLKKRLYALRGRFGLTLGLVQDLFFFSGLLPSLDVEGADALLLFLPLPVDLASFFRTTAFEVLDEDFLLDGDLSAAGGD